MAKTNMTATRVAAQTEGLVRAQVLRSARFGHSFQRVTLAGGNLEGFVPLGYDQWFRLFLPSPAGSLERVPAKLDTLAYLKYLALPKGVRPMLRNYTVAAFRPGGPVGPELDIDFVIHASPDGAMGPAARWALDAAQGDKVAFIDEGLGFNAPAGLERVVILADESGLPAAAGVLASLPRTATGTALLEIPDERDAREINAPSGVDVRWLVRGDSAVPGRLGLEELKGEPIGTEEFYAWAVGESAMATGARRHWVAAGVPKRNVTFCGYWKASTGH
ncbi:siderophore-interacting protein [Paeniglutamicibacter kerguelensis]|uniref:NADPH-dependent ferric siderophore reductase n=1 Tax=Paeniglutamicibacter kerguelensis TaxID=254788 RepID=A0ABS4XAZ9_9MICC|nr:siderophore-interacting protein [Paeniglutamicibacter kerguelensis]MBP2385650.1 NADPH-dependent ferric siderophore reductase [Paeniglutamicibacter kerguelensis]